MARIVETQTELGTIEEIEVPSSVDVTFKGVVVGRAELERVGGTLRASATVSEKCYAGLLEASHRVGLSYSSTGAIEILQNP